MVEPITRAENLRNQIEWETNKNLRLGRMTHGLYLSLGVLIVGSSALSAIMELGFHDQVKSWVIGTIALIPGICAGISDRFHLLLKKHWYYRKYDKLNALGRRMDFILPPYVTDDEITKVALDLCRVDREASKAWELLEDEHPAEQAAKPE